MHIFSINYTNESKLKKIYNFSVFEQKVKRSTVFLLIMEGKNDLKSRTDN